MKDRIKRIMDRENLTPARFADRLQINRAIISHILNGRNNPSLDVVTRILAEMDYIEPEWLLSGKGSMYKEGFDDGNPSHEPNLFDQGGVNDHRAVQQDEETKETGFKSPEIAPQPSDTKAVTIEKTTSKKIAQIIVYYTDNTFEAFRP